MAGGSRGAIQLVSVGAVTVVVLAAAGCMRGHGNATGAGTIEELVDKYEAAHRERSIEKLRDILYWESPQAGSGHVYDIEELMAKLFVVELDEVEFVKGPGPDAPGGREIAYVRPRPGKRRQVDSVIGPLHGKLILIGSVSNGGAKRAVRVDPSYVVMQSLNRYYLDMHPGVLEDAITSVRTGKPSRSDPLPLGTDSSKVPRDW